MEHHRCGTTFLDGVQIGSDRLAEAFQLVARRARFCGRSHGPCRRPLEFERLLIRINDVLPPGEGRAGEEFRRPFAQFLVFDFCNSAMAGRVDVGVRDFLRFDGVQELRNPRPAA